MFFEMIPCFNQVMTEFIIIILNAASLLTEDPPNRMYEQSASSLMRCNVCDSHMWGHNHRAGEEVHLGFTKCWKLITSLQQEAVQAAGVIHRW